MRRNCPRHVPALGVAWLTRFYDTVVGALLDEETFRRRLVDQAAVLPGQRVLDLGCGTATLSIMLKHACPETEVTGLDADAAILDIARRKIGASAAAVLLVQGSGTTLPFARASFDLVVSSLMFHHLHPDEKRRALAELARVLRPGGHVHIADWGRAGSVLMRLAFVPVQLLDGITNTQDHVRVGLVPFLAEAGFRQPVETYRQRTTLGTLSLYKARAAGGYR